MMSDSPSTEPMCYSGMVFAVHPDPCHLLNVIVVDAHNITKGWIRDLVDKPDPYIVLKIPGSRNGSKRTKYFNNDSSPTWNETFTFVLDSDKSYELEIALMDANYTVDGKLGFERISLKNLLLSVEKEVTVKFGEVTELNLKLLLTVDLNPDLRYGISLCDKEREFRKHRQKIVMKALQNILPENYPEKENEIPTIGVVASGGGFRAMTAFSGVMKALWESNTLDIVTYIASLSGSSWYLSTLYSHPEFPKKSPVELLDELKKSVHHSPFWLLCPRYLYRYVSNIKEKRKNGQPVSFTDFFGHLLGDTLLKDRLDARLSDQQRILENAEIPFPLYSCLHVKSNVSAKVFQDWMEFSPCEIGIAKYSAFMKTENFGCKFYKGRIMKRFSEPPLHYLQGIWGSAFCILFKRLIQGSTKFSLDQVNAYSAKESNDEEEIYFDAVEDIKDDEETIQDAFESMDVEQDENDGANSESEEDSESNKESSEEHSDKLTGFWKEFINNISSCSVLETRKGRAGKILNPLRGLSLVPCFPFTPTSPTLPNDNTLFKGLTEPASTLSKTLELVDGGLNFNLPFPLLLRPQRAVDMYLTFDFSSRESDTKAPFKALLLSEKWAELNNCLFPPIQEIVSEYIKQPPKECYVFKHPTNELCPIIIYFPLVNLNFKKFKKPGVPRENEEEIKFADFSIFSDPKKSYSTFNFKYPSTQFDRLHQLMEFNVLNNLDIIKENLDIVVSRRKKFNPEKLVILSDPPRKIYQE